MVLGFIIIAAGIIIDQILKIIVRLNLNVGDKAIPVINDFFYFNHIENDGAAWGVLSGGRIGLILVTLIALVIFGYFYTDVDFKKKKLYSIGLVMMISGTIGNFIDRIIYGTVTDYLDFYIFGYDFPVFNFADMLLVVGVIIFLLDAIIEGIILIKNRDKETSIWQAIKNRFSKKNNIEEEEKDERDNNSSEQE